MKAHIPMLLKHQVQSCLQLLVTSSAGRTQNENGVCFQTSRLDTHLILTYVQLSLEREANVVT